MKLSTLNFLNLITQLIIFLFFFQIGNSQTTINSYIFGHSLVNHSTDSNTQNRSNIPDWLDLLANQDGNTYTVDGQFGFLPFQTLPPLYQWGFINAINTRTDYNNYDFASWNYNNVVVTLANFIQYTQPTDNAFCDQQYINDCNQDPNALSSVEAVLRILDYSRTEIPNINFYIYENWPEFYGTFPPTSPAQEASEFGAYYNYAQGDWHDWWIELQDEVILQRPNSNVKLIPVGPILAKLFSSNGILSSLSATTLYEDEAPHGYPVTYFLTALIHYSALYGQKPPQNFVFPDAALPTPIRIPDLVKNNYNTIVDFIWNELLTYNFDNGNSRVFLPGQVLINENFSKAENQVILYPNPSNNLVNLKISSEIILPIQVNVYNTLGQLILEKTIENSSEKVFELSNKGTYYVMIKNDSFTDTSTIIIN